MHITYIVRNTVHLRKTLLHLGSCKEKGMKDSKRFFFKGKEKKKRGREDNLKTRKTNNADQEETRSYEQMDQLPVMSSPFILFLFWFFWLVFFSVSFLFPGRGRGLARTVLMMH